MSTTNELLPEEMGEVSRLTQLAKDARDRGDLEAAGQLQLEINRLILAALNAPTGNA